MAKGAKITDEVRRLIAGVYLEHSEWRAKEVQREVNTRLRKEKPSVHSDWPGLSAVQKELTKIRTKHEKNPSPLDEQWSVGCLAQYDIPPEALPAVMYIYEKRQRAREIDFTIREVLWIARLHKTIDDLDFLERFASAYALKDKIDWILDSPVNTRGFDFMLLNYCDEDRRDEIIARLNHPGGLNPLSGTSEEQEELKNKLKQKGYDYVTPGERELRKMVDREVEKIRKIMVDKRLPEGLRKSMSAFVLNYNKRKEEAHDERSHSQEVQE